MEAELYKELEKRIRKTKHALKYISRSSDEYILLQNQLTTMQVLKELYTWRIKSDKKEKDS